MSKPSESLVKGKKKNDYDMVTVGTVNHIHIRRRHNSTEHRSYSAVEMKLKNERGLAVIVL